MKYLSCFLYLNNDDINFIDIGFWQSIGLRIAFLSTNEKKWMGMLLNVRLNYFSVTSRNMDPL